MASEASSAGRRRLPLGWHLALLVACAVIPVLVFATILVVRVATEERARVERGMVDVTRALAAALDRELLVHVGVLEALAHSSALAANDLATFHAEAARVLARRPAWENVLLVLPDGTQLMNTGRPYGAPLPRVNEPESLAEVVRTRQPDVGGLARGAVSGELGFPVRVPVVRDDEVVMILTAAVKPPSLQALLSQAVQSRGEWTRAFTDGRGTIVARSREPERYVGQGSSSRFVVRGESSNEDLYRDITIDGADVYVAFSRAPFSRWVAAMAYPVGIVEGPLRQSLALTIGAGIALVGLTGAAAYVVGSRIARPIRAATGAAQALAHGELRRVPPSAVQEVHELAYALERSAALLRGRETERAALLDEARAARVEAEAANRAKDEFLATLSHELRSPLNAMMGWVRLLKSGRLDRERATHAVEVIDRNVALQAQLINDLLDISRIVAGKLRLERRPTDVRDAVRAAVEQVRTVAEDKGVSLEVLTPSMPAMVNGDPARLVQIVGNLLSNAVKFTPAKGRVLVEIERARHEVAVSVTDTGSGIAADVLPHVFERFRQAETGGARGLGLGLAIVRNLTELHGGRVEVASEGEGHGARFVVRLPELAFVGRATAAPVMTAGAARVEGQRVLLVEDDADNRELLETVLRGYRFTVMSVGSAAQALSAWDRERFDLVVSDLRMPEMDGYALISEIRRRENGVRRVRAVAVSANAAQQDKERSLAAGFDAHLSKPIDPDDLLAALV